MHTCTTEHDLRGNGTPSFCDAGPFEINENEFSLIFFICTRFSNLQLNQLKDINNQLVTVSILAPFYFIYLFRRIIKTYLKDLELFKNVVVIKF